MVAGLDVFVVVVLDLTLMTATFGARIFRRAGKYHVGRGVAYTDDCEFPAFQVGGSYIWKKEVCRKSNRVIQKYVNSNVLRANILIIPAARATFSISPLFLLSWEGHRRSYIDSRSSAAHQPGFGGDPPDVRKARKRKGKSTFW